MSMFIDKSLILGYQIQHNVNPKGIEVKNVFCTNVMHWSIFQNDKRDVFLSPAYIFSINFYFVEFDEDDHAESTKTS